MKNFSKNLKFALVAAAVALTVAGLAVSAGAAELTDINGHWSEEYVKYGVDAGYISGYPDATFKPDQSVTRAEFVKMINSAIGISRTAEISFFDVENSDWFYEDVRKAMYAGYVNGYENGAFIASNLITRQEAAVILSRIATRSGEEKSIESFKDASSVADWAKSAFEFAYSKGLISGDDLGNLLPANSLTRGQAAKILYTLRTTENIYNGNYTVELDNAVLSETIFTDDVSFASSSEEASLKIDGCRILGAVKFAAENDSTMTVTESGVATLEISGGHHAVELDKTQIKNVVVKTPAEINGGEIKDVVLEGAALISGITEIQADIETLDINSSAVLKAQKVGSVNVGQKGSVTLQGMTIENMSVLSGAAGSVITLAENVKVNELTVNAAVSFMGTGKIEKANNKVSGVSYETKPEVLSGIEPSEEGEEPVAPGTFKPVSISPANGTTGVLVTANLAVYFEDDVYTASGASVTSSYLEDCFEIRKGTTSGTKVEFIPTVSSTKKFSIYPTSDFAYGTKYYLVVKEGMFRDADGNVNAKATYSFTTEAEETADITFSPASGKTGVDCAGALKITFSGAIVDKNGDKLTTQYLSETAIELREKSLSGTKVDITATINSTNKVITIEPKTVLLASTKYYLVVAQGTLKYSGGSNISREYASFTTSDKLAVTVTPENAQTGVSPDTEITLNFNTPVYRASGSNITTSYLKEEIKLRKSTASGTEIEFTPVISSDRMTVTIIPSELQAGTKYYVVIPAGTFASKSGSENSKISTYFTIVNAMTPSITPVSGETAVSPVDDIVIKFTESLYDAKKNPITEEYIKEKAVVLRRNSSSGTKIDFDVEISPDRAQIIIKPVNGLSAGSTYYVAVAKNTLYNWLGKGNVAGTSTFKTTYSSEPDFLPYNGEEGVDAGANIEIVFDHPVYAIGGAALTTTYVKNNVIELYEDDEDGASVLFGISLSSDKQTIIVNPSADLKSGKQYVVIVRKASLEDAGGNENPMYSSAFTIKEKINTTYTITPANSATKVALNSDIVVKFESPVYRTNGNIASAAYIANNAVELKKSKSTGEKIACTVTVSEDNKTITLTPEEFLDGNTRYYVNIVSKSLVYADGTPVASKSTYFTTNEFLKTIDAEISADEDSSSIHVNVNAHCNGTLTITYKSSDGTKVFRDGLLFDAGEERDFEISDLASGKKYTVTVEFTDENGKVYSISKEVTTVKVVETTPVITKITVVTDSEDKYSATVTDGKAEITIASGAYVKLLAATNITSGGAVSYNGAADKDLGAYSDNIAVTPGSSIEIPVVLTAGEKTVRCTLKINVNE